MSLPNKVARYKIFRGVMASWEDLFSKAAAFATSLGPERLITIAHSEDKDDGVIAVWYWEDAPRARLADKRMSRPESTMIIGE